MSNLIIVPELETPKVFFTANESEYTTITKWLDHFKLEYGRFYASFLNYTIATKRRAATPNQKATLTDSDNALLWIFDDVPVQTEGFVDAMAAYGVEHYDGGITSGTINLKNGRKATAKDFERAHKTLANVLYTHEKQQKLMKEHTELAWLFKASPPKKKKKKKTKAQKRAAQKVATELSALDLGEEMENSEGEEEEEEEEEGEKGDDDYVDT